MECGKNEHDYTRDHAIKWTSTKKQIPANQSFAFIDVRTDSQFVQFAQSNSDVSKLICSHYIVVKLQTKKKNSPVKIISIIEIYFLPSTWIIAKNDGKKGKEHTG